MLEAQDGRDGGLRNAPGFDLTPFPEGAWLVPVEVALACPASSAMKHLVRQRMERQDWPYPDALIFKRGKRFFAEVRFHGGQRPGLLWALDVFATENL